MRELREHFAALGGECAVDPCADSLEPRLAPQRTESRFIAYVGKR